MLNRVLIAIRLFEYYNERIAWDALSTTLYPITSLVLSRSYLIRQGPFNRRFIPSIEAFGERKTILEWSKDPRCVVKYGTLAARLMQDWEPERAISSSPEESLRQRGRPQRNLAAFGEVKLISDWVADPRCKVASNVFLRRIQHGWAPEAAINTPVALTREKPEGHAKQYEAFGEKKTLKEWAQDSRCHVSEMTLRKNLSSDMPIEEAFEYRRKPGRHFGGVQEEVAVEVSTFEKALLMLQAGAELWCYEAADLSRISIIANDVRHPVTVETIDQLFRQGLIAKTFQTDTIKNFELTATGWTHKI